MRRFQLTCTRSCPYFVLLSYSPSKRDPCGMSRTRPVSVSNTFSTMVAIIWPGRSELMPVTSAARISVPAINCRGDRGVSTVPDAYIKESELCSLNERCPATDAPVAPGAPDNPEHADKP